MIKILKIGDFVYGQSIQRSVNTYTKGFPQREFYLYKYTKDIIKTEFYHHDRLKNLQDVYINKARLKQFIFKKEYDYIFIDNPFSYLLVDNQPDISIIFDCIDWYDEMYLKEFGINAGYYLLRYAYLSLLKRADKVIAQSPIILDYLVKWGLQSKKAVIIPNGYDSEFFYPYPLAQIKKSQREISQKHNISFDNKKVIVYTGKLNKWYENIKIIIDAITSDQILLIVGDGPLFKYLPHRSNIIKCGPVPITKVASYTNIADVCVFPVDDCSPIAISEYLAVGKPIVSIKGRLSWLLKNGINGYLVDNNASSWQIGINKAITNSNKISLNNLRISKRLSWKQLSSDFISFVKSK